MEENLNNFSIFLVFVSVIVFFASLLFLIFSPKNRKQALTSFLISIIAFIIGFSTCCATFKLNIH
jgi:uncharacterized membrane protein